MDWETASEKIWEQFCVLDDDKQQDAIENHLGVSIYSMDDFDKFCKKQFGNNYLKAVVAALDGKDNNDFDPGDSFFAWYPEEEMLVSCDVMTDLIDDEDTFVDSLVSENADVLHDMGFSESEVEEFCEAYEEEE